MSKPPVDADEMQGSEAIDRTPVSYWILTCALVVFVALLTGFRAEHQVTDAWEHHRAVVALSENLWPPGDVGNCTYATDEPSIRYSPYSVVLAAIVRVSGLDAFDIVSGGGVVNTLLFCLALWWFLGVYRLRAISTSVLIVVVLLYGRPPGYANSMGLSDLPWHQVNPSAFAASLALISWGIFKRTLDSGRYLLGSALVSLLSCVAVLSHGMTGALALGGLIATALAFEGTRRWRPLGLAFLGVVLTFGLSSLWPWYSFLDAVRSHPDPWYWFNPPIYWSMMGVWCLPALIASVAALPWRREPLVRACYWGLGGAILVGALSLVMRSATLMRLPLAGLLFAQVLVGRYAHAVGVFRIGTWKKRLTGLLAGDGHALAQLFLVALLAYCGYWQLKAIATEPFLARPYIASLLGKEDKQPRNLERYPEVLAGVGRREVILGRPFTVWPAPSFRGRIVAAAHLEYFVPDQRRRWEEVREFFVTAERPRQIEILEKYSVRWILLDETHLDFAGGDERVLEPSAVTARQGGLILMDAHLWRAAR
jgi:hypothetical protein